MPQNSLSRRESVTRKGSKRRLKLPKLLQSKQLLEMPLKRKLQRRKLIAELLKLPSSIVLKKNKKLLQEPENLSRRELMMKDARQNISQKKHAKPSKSA